MIIRPTKNHVLKDHSMKMKWNLILINVCYEELKCKEKDEDTGETTTIDFKGCIIVTKVVYEYLEDNIKVLKSHCSEVDIDCSGTSLSFIYFVFISIFLL